MTTSSTTAGRLPRTRANSHRQQLDKLKAEVQALKDQLRQSQRLATVGTMAAMVAHEFNNILTPIINYAQLAQTNPALMEKAIARAADGGKRATGICKAILGVAAESSAEPQEINLRQLVAETIQAMAREPIRDAIEMTVNIPDELSFNARKIELMQVLLNLLINARSAVLAKSHPRRIEISARRTRQQVTISVCDNGIGISQKNLPKIFEPFFTTSADGKDGRGGHGLGLAICREIISSMKGRISVQSTPGEGAVFTIQLPG